MALLFQPGSKIVCIGDSITDFDRARPYGEGLNGGIGKSYVAIIDGLLKAVDPSLHLRPPGGRRMCWTCIPTM